MANKVDYSKNSPNYTPNSQVRWAFGYPRTIDWITIHWWGDPKQGPTYEGVVAWLCNPRSQVSAHDVITGTRSRVAVIVNYSDAAWHAGNAQGNATSLGFECDPRCRDSDYEAVAQDVAETWRYYGREIPLRTHRSWSATRCPGNYDLNRIVARAREINNPKPVPTPKWVSMDNPRVMLAAKDLRVINLSTGRSVGDVIKAGTKIDFKQKKVVDNVTYLRSKYSTEKKLNYGIDLRNLKEVPAPKPIPVPVQPEWVRNLKDITDVKLSVLPAAGTKVINLNTLSPVNDVIIPKGTQVDIAKETTVGGKKFYISSYSANANIANGVLASDLGVPAVEPPVEKPEWLENLANIADKDMWTRSGTPVLNVENGDVIERLPINTKVRVTHATQVVGKDLLVLEGNKEVIETVYLSDTPLSNPDEDLEKRVSALEQLVESVLQFLQGIFKSFKR